MTTNDRDPDKRFGHDSLDDSQLANRLQTLTHACPALTTEEQHLLDEAARRLNNQRTAQLRDGETRDDSHAQRNAAMIHELERSREDTGDE